MVPGKCVQATKRAGFREGFCRCTGPRKDYRQWNSPQVNHVLIPSRATFVVYDQISSRGYRKTAGCPRRARRKRGNGFVSSTSKVRDLWLERKWKLGARGTPQVLPTRGMKNRFHFWIVNTGVSPASPVGQARWLSSRALSLSTMLSHEHKQERGGGVPYLLIPSINVGSHATPALPFLSVRRSGSPVLKGRRGIQRSRSRWRSYLSYGDEHC